MSARLSKSTTLKLQPLPVFALKLARIFSVLADTVSSHVGSHRRFVNLRSSLRRPNFKKGLPILVLVFAAGLTAFIVLRMFIRTVAKNSPATSVGSRVTIAGAKSSTQLDQYFSFPLIDSKGKVLTNIGFILNSAELRDEIVVKGKRAIAIEGRTFLILTYKITSDFTKALEINAKDYFRLMVNGNETDLLAPDIHNDPVVVQPKSTKFTRVGWPINDSDTQLVLLVGEIEGIKTRVELNLQ